MSRVGLNVALNLSTQGFSNSLNKAKGDMRKFSSDIRRQNEVLGKLGMPGLGRGFGIAGGLAQGLAMGGIGGTVAAVAAPLAGLVALMSGFASLMDNINDAAKGARKTMQSVAKGDSIEPGAMTGFTPLAAKATTTSSKVTASEVLASNMSIRGSKPEDIAQGIAAYAMSSSFNIIKAVVAEDINAGVDFLLGRGVGDLGGRYKAAAIAAMAGDFGPGVSQIAANNLEEARRGNRLMEKQNELMGGN